MSLLRMLSIQRPPVEPSPIRYDPARQVSQIWEHGRWVDTWVAETLTSTKKRDIERGEDVKEV